MKIHFRSRLWWLMAVLWLVPCGPVKSAGSWPAALFTTIITNGPVTNRLNLVFFSEGYTNGQQSQFLADSTNAAASFLSVQPYAEYARYFNVFAIYTNSANSGSTHLNQAAYGVNHTFFNSTYDAAKDTVITIPPNATDSDSSDGQGRINGLLQQFLPATNFDLPALLVNDVVDGGSDNYGATAITSVSYVSYILVHESGHTLGGLGDEYSTPYPGYTNEAEQPNTSTHTNYSQISWNAWLATNTPIPTPTSYAYQAIVGLFQGAHYTTNGWYRPMFDCCMRSFGYTQFCPVCQEALVLAIYGKTRPIDGQTPATNLLTVTSAPMLTFSLNLLQPATHNLHVQWRTNNTAVSGATNANFAIWPAQLGNGTNTVEADVWDATAMVRTDARNLLKQTNLWTLAIAVPVMEINSLRWLTNGTFSFTVTGQAPSVVIQQSTNLRLWTPVQTDYFIGGKLSYTNAGSNPRQFFRTMTP